MRPFVLKEKGDPVTSKNFPVRTNSRLAQWKLTKSSPGVGMISREVGDSEPSVVRATPDSSPIEVDVWLAVHRELRTNRRILYGFDFLHGQLGPLLNANSPWRIEQDAGELPDRATIGGSLFLLVR